MKRATVLDSNENLTGIKLLFHQCFSTPDYQWLPGHISILMNSPILFGMWIPKWKMSDSQTTAFTHLLQPLPTKKQNTRLGWQILFIQVLESIHHRPLLLTVWDTILSSVWRGLSSVLERSLHDSTCKRNTHQ
jgi:hypothetical protein